MSVTKVPVIGITGGPCAGKTMAMDFLREKLSAHGYMVTVIAEAATELVLSGTTPGALGAVAFQRQILKHIIEKENRAIEATRLLETGRQVILCDRGAVDAAAYLSEEEFASLICEFGYSVVQLRDHRYDAIIFMRSVAYDLPGHYNCNNSARLGTSEERARELDLLTLKAWEGHPNLHVVDNSTGFDEKLKRTFLAVCRVLKIEVAE